MGDATPDAAALTDRRGESPLRRLLAVAEVLILLAGIGGAWLLISRVILPKAPQWRPFARWPVIKMLLMTALPIGLLAATRRAPGRSGIHFRGLWYQAKMGLLALIVVLPASCAFGLLLALDIEYFEWRGALILAPVHLAAAALLVLLLRRRPARREPPGASHSVVYLAVLAALAALSALTYSRLPQLSWVVWALFVTGFGEEILFRGYVQSRLNRSFGRPWRLAGVPLGWGLVIASVLFGLMHWATPGGTVWWAVWAACGGLVFGFLREKTGGIVAPGMAHGLPMAMAALASAMP